jgi:hypothetical protein
MALLVIRFGFGVSGVPASPASCFLVGTSIASIWKTFAFQIALE